MWKESFSALALDGLERRDHTLHFEMPPLLALGLQHYFTPKSVGHLPFPEVKSTLNDI